MTVIPRSAATRDLGKGSAARSASRDPSRRYRSPRDDARSKSGATPPARRRGFRRSEESAAALRVLSAAKARMGQGILEARNPKSDTNSTTRLQARNRERATSMFRAFLFGFAACFGFRASDFGFSHASGPLLR